MNRSIFRSSVLVLLVMVGGCGKSDSGGSGGSGACPTNDLQVLFTPMYSAFDGVHPFKVPAVADNIDPALVKWSASDPSMVDLVNDATVGGVMISPRKAGTVTIVASAGAMCGSSQLTITSATPDDWMVGSMRYNNGVVLTGPVTGGGGRPPTDGGTMNEVACTNCHGDTATMQQFRTVSHTPQQTGGFSDDDLLGIFKGMVPRGGYFDSTVVNYNTWHGFHVWQMSPQEAKGVIVYLRSLTPQEQKGSRDFGGRRRDGGMGGPVPPVPVPPGPAVDAGSTD